MKLVSRFVTLFSLIMVLFFIFVVLHEYMEAKEEKQVREEFEKMSTLIIDKFISTKAIPVRECIQSLALSDKSVKSIKRRNIDYFADILNFKGKLHEIGEAWIYTSDFKKIYYFNNSNIATDARDLDSILPEIITRFKNERLYSFYYIRGGNVFEITAASIHPENDREKKGPPSGYILTAIPYDRDYIDHFRSDTPLIADSEISLILCDDLCKQTNIPSAKTLNDINGNKVAFLKTLISEQYISELDSGDTIIRYYIFVLVLAFLISAELTIKGIIIPVKLIYKALYSHNYIPPKNKLKYVSYEFQRIIELVDINKSVELQLGEALRETETSRDIAEKATKAKSEFLANMTHEIRTPMAGVIGFTDMLLDVTIDPVQKELATGIKSSATTVMDIINDILDMSKIESGKFVLLEEPFNINGFLDNFVWLLRGFASDRDLDIRLENRIAHCTTVTGDAKRLKQILLNLGSNAIKFTVDGEVLLTAESAPAGEGAVEITIAVSDTGIGMNEEQMSRIFRQYEQVHDPATFSGGTGLGLAITKSLVTVMGGTLDVRSEQGKGSTFTLKLRMKCTQGEDIKPSLINARNLGLEILIAEDNPISMRVIENIIGKAGCSYESAFNGQDVIELADSKKFDLILMDFHMPVISGIEAALKIRSGTGPNKDTPIYGISADLAERAMEKTGVSMMNGFLMKPFIIEDVYKVLMKVRGEKA